MLVIIYLIIWVFRGPELGLMAVSCPTFDHVGLEHIFSVVALVADVALKRSKSRSVSQNLEEIYHDEQSQMPQSRSIR